jgi:hypothetical protein
MFRIGALCGQGSLQRSAIASAATFGGRALGDLRACWHRTQARPMVAARALMSKLILTGGTDVGEMAVFSADALPIRRPDSAAIDALVERALLLRLPTGAGGAHLLHVYIDEPVPDDVMRYCSTRDARHGRLRFEQGQLGFGGLESASADFAANAAIRSDGSVPAGEYEAAAYPAAFPDALVTNAMRATISPEAKKHLAVPVQFAVIALSVVAVMILLKAWLAASVVALAFAGCLWLFYTHPTTKRLRDQARSVQLAYPSIVVALRSTAR